MVRRKGIAAVVLAAGQGTRLLPLTRNRPKPFLPLVGRPLIGHLLELLRQAGVTDVVVVLSPGAPDLPPYADRFQRCQTVVQPVPRGMADALAHAAPFVRTDFVLCAADQLTDPAHVRALIDRLRDTPEAAAVLSLLPAQQEASSEPLEKVLARSGVAALEGDRVVEIVEKPGPGRAPGDTLSLPLYALRLDTLDLLPQVSFSRRGEREIQTLFQLLLEAGRTILGLLAPWRTTVNTPHQLLQANLDRLAAGEGTGIEAALPADVVVIDPVRIEAGVAVGAGCRLGPGVYLEAGARVGAGAVLEEVIVLRGGIVPPTGTLCRQIVGA